MKRVTQQCVTLLTLFFLYNIVVHSNSDIYHLVVVVPKESLKQQYGE